jgi:hypothetical protein
MSRSLLSVVSLLALVAASHATLIPQPGACVGGLPIVGGLVSTTGGALGLVDCVVDGALGAVGGLLGGVLGGVVPTVNGAVCTVASTKIDVTIDINACTLAQAYLVNQTFLATYGLLGELECLVDSVADLALCALDLLLVPGSTCSRPCWSILHKLSPTCWNSLLAGEGAGPGGVEDNSVAAKGLSSLDSNGNSSRLRRGGCVATGTTASALSHCHGLSALFFSSFKQCRAGWPA